MDIGNECKCFGSNYFNGVNCVPCSLDRCKICDDQDICSNSLA